VNRVTLNLASRPFRNNTVVGSVLAALVAVAVAATVFNLYVYTNYGGRDRELRDEETRHRQRLAALESDERSLSKEIATRDFKRLFGRGQFAGDLILKRAFSWTLLFNKLENVMPAEVMMTAIRPHISNEGIVIRVEGIAKNHGGLIALEDSLQKNTVFAKVSPISERRLNPSRPEITFVMQFDYLGSKAVPGPDAVAAAPGQAAEPGPSATPPGTVEAAAATPTPATATAAAPAPGAPTAAVQPAATERQPIPVLGTVGRDGRPRTSELVARMLAAPGGFYPDTPPPSPPEPKTPTKKPRGKSPDTKPAPAQAGQAGAPVTSGAQGAVPAPVRGGAAGVSDPAAQTSDGRPPDSGSSVSAAAWQDGAIRNVARPPLVAGLPARRDPNLGPPPAARRPKSAPVRSAQPIPATRLDERLSFSARPVGDVYAALSRAHGVRFDIDPTVDTRAPVSADLGGKNLKDAIAVLSKLAGHRVLRVQDGVYRVVPLAGGEPLADRPVQEEALPATEVKP
jgi:Tfp pilus assembly protein PilN